MDKLFWCKFTSRVTFIANLLHDFICFRALSQASNLTCLWKLVADACYFTAELPKTYSFLNVASVLTQVEKIVEDDELYVLAERCYCKILSSTEQNVLIWHDLSVCYLSHARACSSQTLIDRALSIAQHCVSSDPLHWQHWNLLGNIAFYQSKGVTI